MSEQEKVSLQTYVKFLSLKYHVPLYTRGHKLLNVEPPDNKMIYLVCK